ncbi:hypothetical protein CEB3_c23020 [Peptococcaceae bacterium CEB3]|nr:hypothetical protein CEB3_c23020 [Peptococcaceae bacterium CEB3]
MGWPSWPSRRCLRHSVFRVGPAGIVALARVPAPFPLVILLFVNRLSTAGYYEDFRILPNALTCEKDFVQRVANSNMFEFFQEEECTCTR